MFVNAEVFISYSRHDPGPPPAGAKAPTLAKWRARRIALDLIGVLEERLAGKYQIWRDEPSLKPGDYLGHEIDAALLSCSGAVVLLDADALERSSWVRWETTILTWRARIKTDVRVVPVLIDITTKDLNDKGFGPTRVGDLLAAVVDTHGLDPTSDTYRDQLSDIVDHVAEGLGELEGVPTGPVAKWMNAIAACLPANVALWQTPVAEELAPHTARLALAKDPARVVARELLTAERPRFDKILNAFYGFPFVSAPQLKENLEPLWVKADVAPIVASVTEQPPGGRVVAVNAIEPKTGAHVVRRGMPATSPRQRLEWTPAVVTVDGARAEAVKAIQTKWPPDGHSNLLGASFVIMSCGGVQIDELVQIAHGLAARFPELTYVLMVGDSAVTGIDRLDPELPKSADDAAHQFDAALADLLPAT
jgi:hypothetical protein